MFHFISCFIYSSCINCYETAKLENCIINVYRFTIIFPRLNTPTNTPHTAKVYHSQHTFSKL
jgi:hypothetical protein